MSAVIVLILEVSYRVKIVMLLVVMEMVHRLVQKHLPLVPQLW